MNGASQRWTPVAVLAAALDGMILLELLALGIILAGGLDVAGISVHRSAKPLLTLIIATAIRLVLPESPPYARALPAVGDFAGEGRRIRLPSAVRDSLFALIVTRLATFALAFLSNILLPDRQFRPFSMPFRAEKFAEIFAAWDSGWYFDIAQRGYYFNPKGQSSVAFFPLYPMLMRLAAWPFGGSDRAIWIAGITISSLAFFAALVTLHRFTERVLGDREAARRTILYVAVFPFSLFFTRVYTESLFFLLTVLAISNGQAGRWWLAGLTGGLAALTRSNGILVAAPLLWFAIADGARGKQLAGRLSAVALVPCGLLVYCGYLYRLSGDPLAWLRSQRYWFYSVGDMPWRRLLDVMSLIERHGIYDFFFTSPLAPYQLIHGAVALIVLALTPAVFARLGVGLGVYTLVSLVIPLSGSDLQGIGRYMAVVFPIFMALGSFRSPRIHEAILVVSSLFLALFVGLFVNWYPIY